MSPELTITAPEIEQYMRELLPARPPVVAEMEDYAQQHDVPIVGPVVARILFLLAQSIGARRVFEFGSAIGYSTFWWAEAAGEGGEVFFTDFSAENTSLARQYLERAGVAERVRFQTGDALEAFEASTGEFDIIFCDLDKTFYPEVLRRSLPRLRRGGLLVADNVLWDGKVARPDGTAQTTAILEFNRAVYATARLFPVILPVRDGVLVARKG